MQSSTYAYDNLSRLTSTTRSGQTISYTYDAFSHVLTETQPQGTVTYQYDLAGRRTRMEWPDGQAVVYGWYGGPDLITIDIAGTYNFTLASYAYDPIGRVILTGRSNGDSTSFTYDDRSALNTLAMNLLGSSDDLTSTFSRDAATRIIGRSGTNSVYDWAPSSASPSTYAANGLNQYTAAAGASPTYDARGNMTANGTKAYGYDIANHLTSLTVSGTPTASLAYDPVGRLWELAGASTTRFLYDGVDAIAEYDTSGNVLRRYVHGPGSDEPIVWFEGSGTYAPYSLHADERGSVIAVSQGSGAALTTVTYDAYGTRIVSNPTYETRYGFTGQEWLSDIGLYYYKARMYSPELGRFMQTDPIGYGDGMNIYAYVGNDPVNRRDPTGTVADVTVVGTRWVTSYGRDVNPMCIEYDELNDTGTNVCRNRQEGDGETWEQYAGLFNLPTGTCSKRNKSVFLPPATAAAMARVGQTATAPAMSAEAFAFLRPAGAIGLALTLAGDSQQSLPIYRAVGPAEYAGIAATGQFSTNSPSGWGEKQFWTNYSSAKWYAGRTLDLGWESTSIIVATAISQDTWRLGHPFEDAGHSALSYSTITLSAVNIDAAKNGIKMMSVCEK